MHSTTHPEMSHGVLCGPTMFRKQVNRLGGLSGFSIAAAEPSKSTELEERAGHGPAPSFRALHETEHWRAVCQCGSEDVYEEPTDHRVRLDPYDPSTFRHAGQCEYRYTSDPALLRVILKVKDGAGGGYWWVECGTCECGWQVPHYAESVG